MTDKPTLLYILAPSYSGSTLLTFLLARHPEVATVGELKATQMGPAEEYFCSCGDPILRCGFWESMRSQAEADGLEFSIDRFGTVFDGAGLLSDKIVRASVRGNLFERARSLAMHLYPGVSGRLGNCARHNQNIADIVCRIQGGHIFLDGSKDAVRLLHLINSEIWKIKVIYLQRDGRGVSSSIRSHMRIEYMEAVKEWKHSVVELQKMRGRLDPGQVFDLRYEELCKEPEEWLKRIWAWLEVEQVSLERSQFKAGEYHILGNAMRLNRMSDIRLDEKWKRTLTDAELNLFESQAGSLNKQLGYE